jgi:L-lactate dehydrogenase complex protein LldG
MNSREAILAALRAQTLPAAPLPAIEGRWIEYPDLVEQFQTALTRAAGTAVLASSRADVPRIVAELNRVRAALSEGARVCSLLQDVPGNSAAPREPAEYRDVQVLVVPAEFGVAENAAVWIDESLVPVRAGLFLTQHLIVVLSCAQIVPHMHRAYAGLGARVGQKGYGLFLSGPSKTADIEQALVVGAHGPRSLSVVLVRDERAPILDG